MAKRLLRKRPWTETSLTSLLCDLLDEDDQADEQVEYSIDQLNKDLEAEDGLVSLSFKIETHEYQPQVERWVTQSDLGLILRYDDMLMPNNSWSRAWLLQAKRLTPSNRRPLVYSESSGFGGINRDQHGRMQKLRDVVGEDFLRYLLYCPRAGSLENTVRLKLQHLRNTALVTDIFDYSLGLQLREDLLSDDPTVDAGLFVALLDDCPYSLGDIYRSMFRKCSPFSWFILGHFAGGVSGSISHVHHDRTLPFPGSGGTSDLARGIVSGDTDAVQKVVQHLNDSQSKEYKFLPPHTLTIRVGVGSNLEEKNRQIRID